MSACARVEESCAITPTCGHRGRQAKEIGAGDGMARGGAHVQCSRSQVSTRVVVPAANPDGYGTAKIMWCLVCGV